MSDASTQTEHVIIITCPDDVHELSREDLVTLAHSLGTATAKKLEPSITSMEDVKKDPVALQKIDLTEYAQLLNPILTAFLQGIGRKVDSNPHDNHYPLCKSVEAICAYAFPGSILPLHFRESVVLYAVSGSRLAMHLLSSSTPYASYKSIRAWLNNLGSSPAVEAVDLGRKDFAIAFDNNQVLKRSWTVSSDKKCKSSTVTMIAGYSFENDNNLQHTIDLPPSRCLNEEEVGQMKFKDQDPEVRRMRNAHLFPFIMERMKKVLNELEWSTDKFQDSIDEEVIKRKQPVHPKKCDACDKTYGKRKRKCDKCGTDLVAVDIGLPEPDTDAHESHQEVAVRASSMLQNSFRLQLKDPRKVGAKMKVLKERIALPSLLVQTSQSCNHNDCAKLTVMDPCPLNPCSYQAIIDVLRDIGHKCGITKYGTGERKWAMIVCDGLPFTLAARLLQCTQYKNEFDWVLLQPGPGHIEMNMTKAFMELAWEVIMKDVATMLQFRSPKAQLCAKKVTDHHKGWTMLTIARNAIMDELLTTYIKERMTQNEEVSLSQRDFVEYCRTAANPNFRFLAELVMDTLEAIFMFRSGTRTGQPDLMRAAKSVFSPIWTARKHPFYRELDWFDTAMELKRPKNIAQFVDRCTSVNMSGIPETSEGLDFRLEEVNRTVQRYMPPIPQQQDWTKICRNYQTLTNLRTDIYDHKSVQDLSDKGSRRKPEYVKEENLLRCIIRERNYLSSSTDRCPHTSLSGTPLCHDLVHLKAHAREQREQFIDAAFVYEKENTETPSPITFKDWQPICITPDEKAKITAIENSTKPQIIERITAALNDLEGNDELISLKQQWNDLKKNRHALKKNFVDFFHQLEEYSNSVSHESGDVDPDE